MRGLLKAIIFLAKCLPAPVAILFGRFAGWFLQHIISFRRHVIVHQLGKAYADERSADDIASLVTDVYRHLGLLLIELLRWPGVTPERCEELVEIQGLDHLDSALEKGKGILLVGGHLGNWEMGLVALAKKGYTVSAIGKEIKGEAGDMFRRMLRDENGVPTIPRRNSMRQIIRALRNNEIVVMVIDQNMTDDEGVFVDFFGHRACTISGASVIAERTGAAVLPVASYRDDDLLHHHSVISPAVPVVTEPNGDQSSAVINTAAFTREIEQQIDSHPAQWLWIHKRWKTRPADEVESPFNYKKRRA